MHPKQSLIAHKTAFLFRYSNAIRPTLLFIQWPRTCGHWNLNRAKRSNDQHERDLEDVARLYLGGHTQHEIAEHLSADGDRSYSVTQQTVSNDLREIRRRWQESAVCDFGAAMALELAKIDNAERKAWEAWHRSIGQRVVTTAGRDNGGTGNGKERAQVRTEESFGDPRYLATIQRCIDQRRKLLGLDAPVKVAPTNPAGTAPYEGDASDAAILVRLGAVFEQATAQKSDGASGDVD